MICKFACVKPTYHNGNVINIVNSNIAYVKPHIITINNINYLMFEESRINYNNKQIRDDRKIKDYFSKIAHDNKHDIAVEIIIQLGDMKYWN